MPELPNRIDGEIIPADHMNTVQDRSVQRYASVAERDTLNPAPVEGQMAYISDIDGVHVYVGTAWHSVGAGVFLLLSGGVLSGALGMGGNLVENIGNPNTGDDAASWNFGNTVWLQLAGGTMTGPINMGVNAVNMITELVGAAQVRISPNSGGDAVVSVLIGDTDMTVDGWSGSVPFQVHSSELDEYINLTAPIDTHINFNQGLIGTSSGWSTSSEAPNAVIGDDQRIRKSTTVAASQAIVDALEARVAALEAP